MSRVRVVYFGPLKSMLGVSEEEFEVQDGCRVADLVELLASRHGSFLRDMLLHGARSNRGVNIFIDGVSILELGDLQAEIKSDAEVQVMLVSQAAGG